MKNCPPGEHLPASCSRGSSKRIAQNQSAEIRWALRSQANRQGTGKRFREKYKRNVSRNARFDQPFQIRVGSWFLWKGNNSSVKAHRLQQHKLRKELTSSIHSWQQHNVTRCAVDWRRLFHCAQV